MSRFRNPTPKFLKDDGTPLVAGLLYFYESNTAIDKNTYADEDLTIPNTNPVELEGNGDTPNIFYAGDAKVVLRDSAGQQLWERDPVTSGEWSIESDPIFLHDHNEDGSHIVYSSIADLRASTLTPFDGQKISLTGHTSEGDGGGGDFYWDATSTESDNNGTIIKVTSITTGRWIRLYSGYINYLWFGTGSTAMQAAIDIFGQQTGQVLGDGNTIFIPEGLHDFGTQIDVYTNIHIKGAGRGATTVNFTGTGFCFKNVNNANNFSYSDMTIYGQSNTDSDGGIYVGNSSSESGFTAYVSISNVTISAFHKTDAAGLMFENPSHVSIDLVNIIAIPNGKAHLVYTNIGNTGLFHYKACKFGDPNNTDTALWIQCNGGAGTFIDGLVFDACFFNGTDQGIVIEEALSPGQPTRNIQFNGGHLESIRPSFGGAAVKINEGINISFNEFAIHMSSNLEIGYLFSNNGEIGNIAINRSYVIGVGSTQHAIKVNSSDTGKIGDIVYNDCMFSQDGSFPFTTPEQTFDDPFGYLKDANVPVRNLIRNGDMWAWGAGTSTAPSYWEIQTDGTGTITRDTSSKKIGTASSALSLATGTFYSIIQRVVNFSDFKGKVVNLASYIKIPSGGAGRLSVFDGVDTTSLTLSDTGNQWHLEGVSHKVNSAATSLQVKLIADNAAGCSFDGAILSDNSAVYQWAKHPTDNSIYQRSFTYDPPSIAAGSQAVTTVTVSGASVGDIVRFGFPYDLQGITATGYVSASSTVTMILYNGTVGAIDLASSGSWVVEVIEQ